jgi:hypothetical protein
VVVRVPIRLVSEANTRENRFAKAARIAEQRRVTRLCLDAFSLRPPAPTPKLVVTIVRLLGPHAMRFDQGGNRQGAAKAVQDEIADWLGIDDRHEDLVRYDVLEQRAAAHGIRIEIRSHP